MATPKGPGRRTSSSNQSAISSSSSPSGANREKDSFSSFSNSIFDLAKANNETLRAMNFIGKNIEKLAKDTTANQELNKINKANKSVISSQILKKQKQEKVSEELLDLIKQVSQKTGYKKGRVASELTSENSDIFKALPEQMQTYMKALLADSDLNVKEALQNLEKQDKEKTEKTKAFFSGMVDKFDKVLDKNSAILKNSVLGPLTLLTDPLEKFFGFDLMDVGKGAIGKITGKNKRNPSINDVAKNGEMGILFLWNKIKGKFTEEDDKGNFKLKDFLTKIPAGLAGTLMKGGAIAAIAAGLIWAVVDGIKGAMMADKWGVSKVSGFLGGFLGGTGEGFSGGFKNMGKWALMGAGAGFLIGGPIGALAGGLLGAAIGMILGYIGGEKIAKGADAIGKEFEASWKKPWSERIFAVISTGLGAIVTGMTNFLSYIPTMLIGIFVKDKGKLENIRKGFLAYFETFFLGIKFLQEFFKNLGESFRGIVEGIKGILSGKDVKKNILKVIGNFLKIIFGVFISIGKAVGNLKLTKLIWDKALKPMLDWIGGKVEIGKDAIASVWKSVSTFFSGIFSSLGTGIDKFFTETPVGKFIKQFVFDPITNFFSMIGDFFTYIGTMNAFDIVKGLANGDFTKGFGEYRANKLEKVKDAIIRTDGSIVMTDPADTIIATKNNPVLNGSPVYNNSSSSSSSTTQGSSSTTVSGDTSSLERKFDKMIQLLQGILSKEPANISFPKQSSRDLDLIINGGAF